MDSKASFTKNAPKVMDEYPGQSSKRIVGQDVLDDRVIAAFRRLGAVSIIVVYAIGTMGITMIALSVVAFAATVAHLEWLKALVCAEKREPLHMAISGLEFLFLSPLAFLVLRSLGEYTEDLKSKDEIAKAIKSVAIEKLRRQIKRLRDLEAPENIKTNESTSEDPKNSTDFLPIGKECMLETKALTIALLFAIVATHLIGRLIGGHTGEEISKTEGVVGLSLLAILALIYFGVEFLVRTLKKDDKP